MSLGADDHNLDILEKIAKLGEDVRTEQNCEEYAEATGRYFQAMTHYPEGFEALKELPRIIAELQEPWRTVLRPDDEITKYYREAGHDIESLFNPRGINRCKRCGSAQIDLSEDLMYGDMRKCEPN